MHNGRLSTRRVNRGHLLIEDLPGLGKTILAQSLARVLGLSYQRIQFTSDLLPADIVGVSIFQQREGKFEFQPGPIFAQLVLADEVNRATPKANPSDQIGTFPLPESQLDRFLMRLELGYPNEQNERLLITGTDRRELLSGIEPTLNGDILLELQNAAAQVHMSDPLVDYVQAGLSPRGSLAIVAAARAHAFIEHHSGVFPDDVQAVFAAVAGHRLKPASNSAYRTPAELSRHVLDSVAIP
jgi:MoxR-like ATPase